MSNLLTALNTKAYLSLRRKSVQTCSRWAEQYSYVKGQRYSFAEFPWCRELHDAREEECVARKAAQMGVSQALLNIALFTIDYLNGSVLYLLPNRTPDATDFSTTRFDPLLEASPYLSNLFSDVKSQAIKRAGNRCLFIRGARTRTALKSVPVQLICFDEYDEMPQKNIALANERTSGHKNPQSWKITTPTIPDYGIDQEFKNSTQEVYQVPCYHCNHWQELSEHNLQIPTDDPNSDDIRGTKLICTRCKRDLPHETKREWLAYAKYIPAQPGRIIRGFQVNQLYSMQIEPWRIAQTWLRGQYEPEHLQEFYNSKLARPFVTAGAKVTPEQVEACIGNHYTSDPPAKGFITMGIDTGSVHHYEIVLWKIQGEPMSDVVNDQAHAFVLAAGSVETLADLVAISKKYNPHCTTIDALPEQTLAKDLQKAIHNAFRVYMGSEALGSNVSVDEENQVVKVSRTFWLEAALRRFGKNAITLPQDISSEYRRHICEPTKIPYLKNDGSAGVRFQSVNSDHLAFARFYSEIALKVFFNTYAVAKPLARAM